jgi:hypothetical protein
VTQDKQKDPKIRKNVSLRESVIKTGEALADILYKGSFSKLLEDLVRDAQKRHALGEDKNLSELLAEVRLLKEKLRSRRGIDRAGQDMAAEYQRLFEEANSRLEDGRKVEDTIKSGRWAAAASR